MHKYQLLRLRADELKAVLEEYASRDSDVEFFFKLWMPWYEKIQRREIRLPCHEYSLGIYFANPDLSPLAERYGFVALPNLLEKTYTNFDAAIGDWLSDPLYLARVNAAGEDPDIVLDEAPPPDEEIPLIESPAKHVKQGWLKKLIFDRR